MACRHQAAVRAQRRACGELEALGVSWSAYARCPDCGRLVELCWEAGRCTVWERRPTGLAFLREEAAPPAEPPPGELASAAPRDPARTEDGADLQPRPPRPAGRLGYALTSRPAAWRAWPAWRAVRAPAPGGSGGHQARPSPVAGSGTAGDCCLRDDAWPWGALLARGKCWHCGCYAERPRCWACGRPVRRWSRCPPARALRRWWWRRRHPIGDWP